MSINKTGRLLGLAAALSVSAIIVLALASMAREAYASGLFSKHEDGEHEKSESKERYEKSDRHGGYNLASAELSVAYQEECSACHVAYPPALLPARSWQLTMATLDNHFGEDASLDDTTRQEITDYLTRHAALKNSRFMLRISDDRTPQRITELPYFVRKHDEVPRRMVNGNPEVNSFSNCDACHRDAKRGVFNEDTVDIPGFGRWDD
ncbi:diheme cytochrome c [Oceanobacter mangrovi]|uniref:diheme cytochrome c n=1 Tax=Oceanobacter mangrovi TaxID=2862510 RepID=UPI001C8E17D6|nr:diheme cytochrome c [Oceanobacter mangrovi]